MEWPLDWIRTASLLIATTARVASSQLRIRLLGLTVFLALVGPASASAPQPSSLRMPDFAPDHVLVGYEAGTPRTVERSIEASIGARESGLVGADTHFLQVAPGRVLSAVEALKHEAGVRYAEPDWVLAADQIPNDPGLGNQWGLLNTGQTIGVNQGTTISGTPGADIKATAAWDVTTGKAWDPITSPAAPVVGVVDTGVYYNHPDLAPNMWADPLPFDFKYTYTDSGGTLHTDTTCPQGSHGWDSITPPLRPVRPCIAPLARFDGQRSHRGEGRQLNWHRRSQLERTTHGLALGPERVPVRVYVANDRGD